MKPSLTSLFLLLTLFSHGQKTITLNNHSFTLKNVSEYNDSGDSIKKISLFRDKTKLLTHTINASFGDCNSESIEIGDYEVSDSAITFYSYWNRAGDAPASPYGVRKQIYKVDSLGKLRLSQAEIYIETTKSEREESKGMDFLFNPPKTAEEKKELKGYTDQVEKDFDAKFVYGKSKETLLKEVKTKLAKPIQKATKHWKSVYGNKFGGYKL